jgi:1-acyl-sn-glycerol-3-phosphate acyltransferase
MSKRERIYEWSLLYRLLQIFPVGPAHNMYYRKIVVQNVERIPERQPVILAPNHQNALMDAMAFVAGIKRQTVFLARADIFKGKLVNNILTFLKILPIYRIRDGISSLQKNDEIFDITVNVLRYKVNPLLMFPEGNHGDKRRLRPLVKGIFRIAFKAQEEYGKEKGVKIIPVGIDYSHYQKFRQTQLINFGEPIEVNEFWDDYVENQSVAINKLRDRLAIEMKKVMINIETEDYYDLYIGLRRICNPVICSKESLKQGDLYQEFLADKKLIATLDRCLKSEPERIEKLDKLFHDYISLRDKLRFRDWVARKKHYSIFLNGIGLVFSLLALPLVLLGLFNNWPHFFLPLLLPKGIRDRQFHSTAKWGAGFAIMIVYYLILLVLALIFFPHWWIKLLFILTLPSSGIFVLSYRRFVIKSWARIRFTLNRWRKDKKTTEFKHKHDTIQKLTEALYNDYREN